MKTSSFESVIGLEIHAQLLTKTKLFCGCSTQYGNPPNSLTCPVCLGLPGALPVLNQEAVAMAVKLALAIKAQLNLRSVFSRKNYFYPDLPKGYQITQYHLPVAINGYLKIESNGTYKTIGIERINLEEDAGKSIHEGMPDSAQKTYLDFNRSGIPLLEIVGKPEINSPSEAVEFLQLFRTTLQYIEICDGNMEEGSLRCDANLSVRKKGSSKLGIKTEIKNLNSFRFLHKALEYEAQRQIALLEAGQSVSQETRLWDEKANKTRPMRTKEEAHDYRYFPEPDLPPLVISANFINKIKATLPEFPQEKRERFEQQYKLPAYDAKVLTSSRQLANYFEQTAKICQQPKQASHWIMREVLQFLKDSGITISEFPVSPQNLAELIMLVEKKEISLRTAKEEVFPEMIKTKQKATAIIKRKGLTQVSDEEQIKNIILRVTKDNPKPLKQYLGGKTQVAGFFVGQVMKETRGRANPQLVNKILRQILDGYQK